MGNIESIFPLKYKIKTNNLLRGEENGISLDDILTMKRGISDIDETAKSQSKTFVNLSSVSEQQLKEIHSVYGEGGLLRLLLLAYTHDSYEFNHFFKMLAEKLIFLKIDPKAEGPELQCDNDNLSQDACLANFNWNVLLPGLSRKIFNIGCREGYMVYGLGGPRILVSHPFQGIEGDEYDIFHNTIDVVTSLNHRGYDGTFLFLDNIPSLNFDVEGVPAWALWFSITAVHSDLVLFIKEYETDFGDSQKIEIAVTPDTVQKKIVGIPHDELQWAKKPQTALPEEYIYLTENGIVSKEDFYEEPTRIQLSIIIDYKRTCFPDDRFIRIDEDGSITEYPLDYPVLGNL